MGCSVPFLRCSTRRADAFLATGPPGRAEAVVSICSCEKRTPAGGLLEEVIAAVAQRRVSLLIAVQNDVQLWPPEGVLPFSCRKAVPVSFPADPLPIGLLARYCSSD